MKEKKYSRRIKIRFLTALYLIKRLKQIKIAEIAPHVRYSQLPSNISTMVFGRYKIKIFIVNKIKSNKHIISHEQTTNG